jgi:hypothetical protein
VYDVIFVIFVIFLTCSLHNPLESSRPTTTSFPHAAMPTHTQSNNLITALLTPLNHRWQLPLMDISFSVTSGRDLAHQIGGDLPSPRPTFVEKQFIGGRIRDSNSLSFHSRSRGSQLERK